MTSQWYKQSYSRLLIDNHITEDDPSFMTQFDPAAYVARVKKAGIDAAMVYACCHNGNCYYPTRVGHMHANLKERDIFGETVTLLRKEGIIPIAYYTTIYHNHSAKTHRSWRMQDVNGVQHDGRYWWSCLNNVEYRQFVKDQIGEVIAYDIDGIFIDMTFWPIVCYCPSCRARYRAETGRELPLVVNWRDPEWVSFQFFRQHSLVSFTQEITGFIKSTKDITVTHQNSPIIQGWYIGQSNGIADSCDYASGDFYGGKYQHILGAKILAAASKNQPYEFMTSRCVNLGDHTSMKSEAELVCESATTLANAGACFFIDAINPVGTLDNKVYERLGRVTQHIKPFTRKLKELNPVLFADTALYYSMVSHVDEKLNGTPIKSLADNPWKLGLTLTPPIEEMTGTTVLLTRMHHPYRVIRDDASLDGLSTLIINNALFISPAEADRIRLFVYQGGTLIATGLTALLEPDGGTNGDFTLTDLFGVSYTGLSSKRVNYLYLPDQNLYVACTRPAPLVKATTATVLGLVAEPYFDPDNPTRYASIHSNPPGQLTDYAALTINPYGKGQCIYLYSPLLGTQQDAQQVFSEWLVRHYAPSNMLISTNAPTCVEITFLKSQDRESYLVGFVNYQRELPNVPINDLVTRFKLPGINVPESCTRVSDGAVLPVTRDDGINTIKIPYLETIEMLELKPV